MSIIAINSATAETSIALLSPGKVFAEKSWLSKKDEAEKILPEMMKLIISMSPDDIEKIFVIRGPGPFTGLRIGITIANSLAWSAKAKIEAVDVFEYMKGRLPLSLQKKTAIIVKAGGDYVGVMLPGDKKEKLLTWLLLPTCLKKSKLTHVFFEMNPSDRLAIEKNLHQAGLKLKTVSPKELKSFGQTVSLLLKNKRKTAKLIKPLYLQKPHITQSKKEIFGIK